MKMLALKNGQVLSPEFCRNIAAKNLECKCIPMPQKGVNDSTNINSISLEGLSIDLKTGIVKANDKQIILSKTELNLLIIFVFNPEKILSVDQLNIALSSKRLGKSEENPIIINHIRRLKRKFLEAGLFCGPKSIYTKGYIWNPIVSRNLSL